MYRTDETGKAGEQGSGRSSERKNLRYIPGIEIDCTFQGMDFHVLGYGIDYKSGDFADLEQNIEKQSFQASLKRLTQTQALGFHVTENDMWELSKDRYWKAIWTGEMFVEVLLSKPVYADHSLLKPYRPGGSRGDNPYVNFYWDYYAQRKLCYVPMEYPEMRKIIGMIHANGGFAVLAHPWVNLKENICMLDEILDLGLDGIEAFSSYHTREQAEFLYSKAQERHLIATYGSDYHGKTKPAIGLGQHQLHILQLSFPLSTNF